MAAENPSEVFRAYLAPLAVDGTGARVEERWTGVRDWSAKAVTGQIPALIETMRGQAVSDETALVPFYQALTAADETFTTIGAEQQCKLLAAAAVDHVFTTKHGLDVPASLAVLTSSWGGRAPTGLPVEIVARATAELDDIAEAARSRVDIEESLKKVATPVLKADTPALTGLRADDADVSLVPPAIDDMLSQMNKALAGLATSTRLVLGALRDHVDHADEENDVLWFVFGGYSFEGHAPFAALDAKIAAFLIPFEIADLTGSPLRSEAAKELFARCGAKGKAVAFVDAVEALDQQWLGQFIGDYSASLLPIHFALKRRLDLVDPKAWVAGWSKATGVAAGISVAPTELAMAFYRERMLLSSLA